MAGSGWLYKSSSTHLQALNTDWWWHFTKSSREEKRQQLKVFSIYANSGCQCASGCFVNNDKPIWWFHTLVRHMEVTLLSVATVCLVWLGVTIGLLCVNAHMCENMCVVFVCLFFSFCDSILLDFWAQSTVHMVLATWRMAYVSVMVKPIRQERGVWKAEKDRMRMWQKARGWGESERKEEGAMPHWDVTFCLPCDAIWIQVVFINLHGWLIKSEKSELLPNWTAWLHVSTLSYPCVNRLHNTAICIICLCLDFTRILKKGLIFFFFLTTIIQSVSCSHFSCMLCKCVVDCITNNANQCCLFSISATKCSCFINSISPVFKP